MIKPIRLLLIDDHAVFCDMAVRALSSEPGIDVIGQADSVQAGLNLLNSAEPDIVLLDYDLRGGSGIHFIQAAHDRGFAGRILMLSAGVPDSQLYAALRQGISGLVLKEEPLDRLVAAIRAVSEGRTWLSEKHVKAMMMPEAHTTSLTRRECEVLSLVLDGLSNKEIGAQLNMPETTVKSTLQLLFKKTGVRTRGSLIRVALEKYRGLLR
jgi:two-component system nitrate/nitrite response regulator NarL